MIISYYNLFKIRKRKKQFTVAAVLNIEQQTVLFYSVISEVSFFVENPVLTVNLIFFLNDNKPS